MRGVEKAETVEEYLSRLPVKQRTALEKLRKQIRSAAPGVEEYIGYGMPMFKLHGRLCAFAAFTNHLSFFPMTSALLPKFAAELKGFHTSKGTLQFMPEKPIPSAMIKKLVRARVAQNREIEGERARKKASRNKKPKRR